MTKIALPPLRHRFEIKPVSEKRAQTIRAFAASHRYAEEPIPDHIRDAVRIEEPEEGLLRVAGPAETVWFPKPLMRPQHFQMARGMGAHLRKAYTLPGFVDVEPGDAVVDCGAFVGGFTLGVAGTAARVVAVEPASRSFECLTRNVAGLPVQCLRAALSDRGGTATFAIRANPTDNSLLDDDFEPEVATETVPLLTVPELMERAGLGRIDFLKVEAEGAELEVLAGVSPDRVRKVAVAAGRERNGESPFLDAAVLLANRGYRLANDNYFLFARAD